MREDYEKLFSYLKAPEPSDGLFSDILSRIKRERQIIILRKRLVLFSIGMIGSVIAFFPAFSAVWADLSQSGFASFMSLIFSDSAEVLVLWQDFMFFVLEAIPVLGITMLLAALFVFLGSAKLFMKDFKIVFPNSRLIIN